MNKLKAISVVILLLFSFYYISKVNSVIITQNSLMKTIEKNSSMFYIDPINANIIEDFIIPGISGKQVNVFESYYNMRHLNYFNENYLIYDEINPSISVMSNKDKYIIKGNAISRNISFILKDNKAVETFLINNKVPFNKLISSQEEIKEGFESINNSYENFKELDSFIDEKICIVNDQIEEICKNYEYTLVKTEIILNSENYLEIKNNIYSGSIIYISDYLPYENFSVIYKEILFKNYEIVHLSKLIEE